MAILTILDDDTGEEIPIMESDLELLHTSDSGDKHYFFQHDATDEDTVIDFLGFIGISSDGNESSDNETMDIPTGNLTYTEDSLLYESGDYKIELLGIENIENMTLLSG